METQLGFKACWRTGSRTRQEFDLKADLVRCRIAALRNQSRVRKAAALKAMDASSNASFILRCWLCVCATELSWLGSICWVVRCSPDIDEMSMSAQSRAGLWRQICPWPLARRLLRQALNHRVGD